MIPLVILPFYNNNYLKDVQAFYAKELPISSPDSITSPAILTPTPILPPHYYLILDISLFLKNYCHLRSKSVPHLLPQLYELHLHRIKRMEEGHTNGNKLKTELKRIRTQIIRLQKKRLGQKDKIAFAYYRTSNLEQIIKEIQARHQTDQEDL
ncbi:hypothetical protein Tco_1096368 [Tanacetum coccineum]